MVNDETSIRSSKKKLISMVFSFRNEQENIPELIRRTQDALSGHPYDHELIFVNDDSNDGSMALLDTFARQDSRIKVINMSRRFGVSECVLAGMRHSSGDAVIYMDADLQDPPELIPELLEKWQQGAEVVHTTRTERLGESWLKMRITALAYWIINLFADIHIRPNTGDFKLLSRRAIDELLRLQEADPFLRGLVNWIGFEQSYVYYRRDPRHAGDTHYPLLRSLNPTRAFFSGLTSFSSTPLYISLVMGFLVSLIAFVYLVVVVVTKYLGLNIPGWTALMVTILFMGGINLLTIGVLGVYIGRIFKIVRSRPQYIIRELVNLSGDEAFSLSTAPAPCRGGPLHSAHKRRPFRRSFGGRSGYRRQGLRPSTNRRRASG
ncbi:MAG: glycosyltransferase family 2 protein [Magnetococcales bacterium]|nr:glycosyltransferase family 2 protein [Magnetococcales bacterium]